LGPNHEHHILTTVQSKLIPPNFINQENYFNQEDISSQENYFNQEDISSQENYFSLKDISSQENYFSQKEISSQSYFPIENTTQSYSDCNEYEQAPFFHQSNHFCNNVSFNSDLDYQSPTNQSSGLDLDQFLCSYQQAEQSNQSYSSSDSENTFVPNHSQDSILLEEFDQYLISDPNSYPPNSPVQLLVPQTFENYLNIPTAEGTISVTFDVTQACKGSSLKKTNSEKCREYRNKKKEKEKHLAEEHEREMERNITLKFKLQEMERKAEAWKKYILKHVKAQKCSKNNVKVPGNIIYSFCDI